MMKQWITLLLALALCISLAACAGEQECENCAKLEKEIEQLEKQIEKLKEEEEESDGEGPNWDDLFGTEPEIRSTHAFSVPTASGLTIDLPGNSVDFDTCARVDWYGELMLLPSDLNLDSSGFLITDSLLQTPVYGADGRVTDIIANTVSGTYDTKKNAFTSNENAGFRAVGPAVDGVITDIYSYVFDLTFQTQAEYATLIFDAGFFLLPADQGITEYDIKEEFCGCMYLVFYDTATGEVLGVAGADPEGVVLTADEKSYHVPLEYGSYLGEGNYLTEVKLEQPRKISVLLWLNGYDLSNEHVMMNIGGITYINVVFDVAS